MKILLVEYNQSFQACENVDIIHDWLTMTIVFIIAITKYRKIGKSTIRKKLLNLFCQIES